MLLRRIDHGERLSVSRGQVVVCVSAAVSPAEISATLDSVLRHTPEDVPILIVGVSSGEVPAGVQATPGAAERLTLLTSAGGHGLTADIAGVAAPADLVWLEAGCRVGPEWTALLAQAAGSDPAIATASPINSQLAGLTSADVPPDRAQGVAAGSLRLRPRLDAPLGPCVYIRRSAIELVGPEAVGGGRFAAECRRRGLHHVLADDVLVQTPGPAVATDGPGPVRRAVGAVRRAIDGLSVTIDARTLTGPLNGTRVHVMELIAAVAAVGGARVTAAVAPDLDDATRERLAGLPDVTVATLGPGAGAPLARADVVHRPAQVSTPADLAVLGALGDRLIVTHQDLISYHAAGYFRSDAAWQSYQALTRRALGAADWVVFESHYVREDALSEELVDPERTVVIPIGVDHAVIGRSDEPCRPGRVPEPTPDAEMMLCLGTDFQHKNRVFALRVLRELQDRHGWRGRLVLAGPRVAYGSSQADEQALLAQSPTLAQAVVDLGQVTDAEREWLLRHAAVVLYPTVSEGFGLIPYEAAERDVPCLWAPGTALDERLGAEAARIVPWEAAATADRTLALMRNPDERRANVAAVRAASAGLLWQTTAQRLLTLYDEVCRRPSAPAAVAERGDGLMRGNLTEDAMRLVGPDGVLPRELERPLLALMTRPRLARPFGAAVKAAYRVSQRGRPRTEGERSPEPGR